MAPLAKGTPCCTTVARWCADGAKALSCRDPDANEQIFVEDKEIQPIMEAKTGPMVPWTRLW